MLDPEVVEFYQTMQKPRLEVEMRIPVEYEDEVRRFLAQLQARVSQRKL